MDGATISTHSISRVVGQGSKLQDFVVGIDFLKRQHLFRHSIRVKVFNLTAFAEIVDAYMSSKHFI